MTWVRLDDAIGEHPKIAALSDSAFALLVTGLAYANRNLTDGFIPTAVGIGQLRYCDGNAIPGIRELEASGLWEPIGGGWQIHDFADYQPTRAAVVEKRESERTAKHRAGVRRAAEAGRDAGGRFRRSDQESPADVQQGDQHATSPVPVPVPVPETAESKGASADVGTPKLILSDRTPYFLDKLHAADARWRSVTIPAVVKLAKAYDMDSVTVALSFAAEGPPEITDTAYGWLEGTTRGLYEAKAGAA